MMHGPKAPNVVSDGSFAKQSEVRKRTTKHNAMKAALSTCVMEFYTWPGAGMYGPNFPTFPQSFETNSGYLIPSHEEQNMYERKRRKRSEGIV